MRYNTVLGKNSEEIRNYKDRKECGMCKNENGVKVNSSLILQGPKWLCAGPPCQPLHVDEDEHVEEEGDEDQGETSKNPNRQRCQAFKRLKI